MELKEYSLERFSYPSADGVNSVAAYVYIPETESVRGIVQIVHGMSEYFLRYDAFCSFLAQRGFVVCGNDHIGHGYTASTPDDLGFTSENDGAEILASDVYMLSGLIKDRFPRTPHVLLGHSMGSLIARYCISIYHDITDSCIIMGTVGWNTPAKLAKLIAGANSKIFGGNNRSAFIKKLAFGSYNRKFSKENSSSAWISSDKNTVEKYDSDSLAGFDFTARGYYDLFDLVAHVNSDKWVQSLDKELPILVVFGRNDPVGDYGRGVLKMCEKLYAAGVENMRYKVYKNSRHELLNDVDRDEVYADLYSWISGICDRQTENADED